MVWRFFFALVPLQGAPPHGGPGVERALLARVRSQPFRPVAGLGLGWLSFYGFSFVLAHGWILVGFGLVLASA